MRKSDKDFLKGLMTSLNPHAVVSKAAKILGGWDKLQEKLGVSRQCIWYWENKKRAPNAEAVLKCVRIIERHQQDTEEFS